MAFPTDLSAIVDNVNDVLAQYVNNLEAKVGIDGSAEVTSHDYKLSGVTGSEKAVSTGAKAIGSEVIAGTEDAKYVTPKAITDGRQVCRAYLGGAQTLTDNTFTKIELNTENFDVGGNFDHVTNYRFVAPVTGYYAVTGAITYTTGVDAKRLAVTIYKQGAAHSVVNAHCSINVSITPVVSDVVQLNAGQYVELYGWQNTGGDAILTVGSTRAWLSVVLL